MVQAHRTSSKLLEPRHCRDSNVCRVLSLGWFEPSLTTSLQGKRGVQGAYAPELLLNHIITEIARFWCRILSHEVGVVRLNLLYLHRYRVNKVCRLLMTSSGWFKHTQPLRTFSNHVIAEIARCGEFFHMSSGWFDDTD